MSNLIIKAMDFAATRHAGQKYGKDPYICHLAEVEKTLIDFGYEKDIELRAAAWLHDIVEDTNTTFTEIAERLTHETAYLVSLVTDSKTGVSRRDRQLNTYWLTRTSDRATALKLADRISNMRFSLEPGQSSIFAKMYAYEYYNFKFALYIPNHHERMWECLDMLHSMCAKY